MLELKPFIQSDDSLCGPACMKMVLDYYGISIEEQELAKMVNHTYELGCTNEAMEQAFQRLGFKVFYKTNATIEDLDLFTSLNMPVIVDWFPEGEGHSSIVLGVSSGCVLIQDPLEYHGKAIKKEDFNRCWFDFTGDVITSDNLVPRYMMVIYKVV